MPRILLTLEVVPGVAQGEDPQGRGATGVQEAGQGGGPTELFVIRLKHARASDVAGTVGALFGIAAGGGGSRMLSTGTLSDELRRTAAATTAAPQSHSPPGSAAMGQEATLVAAVTIVPDARTNSLLIRASAADYAIIERAVQQLDLGRSLTQRDAAVRSEPPDRA